MSQKQKSQIPSSKLGKRHSAKRRIEPSTLALMLLAGILSGCAGLPSDRVASSDSSAGMPGDLVGGESGSESSRASLIGGKAINGYLENALIFNDVNNDGLLGRGESFALSDRLGNYLLANPVVAPMVVKSLNFLSDAERGVVENSLSTQQIQQFRNLETKQLTDAGSQVNWTGVLKANLSSIKSGEAVNITPYTTLFQSLSEQVGAVEAQALIQTVYGIDPDQDYVKAVSQGLISSDIQSQANALTNLIRIAINAWGDEVSPEQIFNALAEQLLEVSQALEAQGLSLSKASNVFTQSDQIQAIYVELLKDLNLEIAVSDLRVVIESAVDANRSYVTTPSIYLVNDTGISYDQITSDWRVNVSDISLGDREYLLKPSINGYFDDPQVMDLWLKDLSESQDGFVYKPSAEGFYRLYVRDASDIDKIKSIDFFFDQLAPVINPVRASLLSTDSQIPEVSSSRSDKITSNAALDNGLLSQLLTENGASLEYYVTKNIGQTQPANDVLWLDFYNFPRSSLNPNGDQITVWLRAKDVAGNISSPVAFEFQYDPNSPDALNFDRVQLSQDTGLSTRDWVTQNLDLVNIQNWANENRFLVDYAVKDINAISNINWVRSYQAPEVDGNYELFFRVIDAAGNYSSVFSVEATLDRQAPTAIRTDELYLVRDTNNEQGGEADGITADPTVWGQRLPETWFEYRVKNTNDEIIQEWSTELGINRDGAYSVEIRRIDLAGNHEGAPPSFEVIYDGTAPEIELSEGVDLQAIFDRSTWQSDLSGEFSSNETAVIWSYDREFLILEGDIELAAYRVQAEDRVGNQSAVWEYQIFDDFTERTQMLRNEFDPNAVYASTQEASIWDGLGSGSESIDYRVLGSVGNDLFKNLDSGDLFLGGSGYDVAEFSSNANFLGIGFANANELDGVTSLLSGINPNQDLTPSQIDSTPLLKLFSQSPFDDTEQGLSFVQADVIRYTDSNQTTQTIHLTQNQITGTYTLNLASTNNFLFFDGQGVLVNAGNQADELIGGALNDVFYGQSSGLGIDKLNGGFGDDILVAGSTELSTFDRTIIQGGEGDDRIYLVNGQLTASGGQGADSFYVAPKFYGENAALNLKVTDFEIGIDKLFLPDAIKEYALDHFQITDDGLELYINLHGASLDTNNSLGYGSRINLMFEEAVSVPDAQEIFMQLILSEAETYRSWDELSKDWV
jgi:hypothetical protein